MRTSIVLALATLFAAIVVVAQAPATYTISNAPPEYKAPVARALKAFDTLQSTLSARLMEEMKARGPAAAIVVCRDEAPAMTTRIARESQIALGRTSHRLRNPSNAPRPWAAALVEEAAGRKAADVAPMVVDLGDRIGVLRPIATMGACTTCHGTDEKRPPALKEVLQSTYPQDKAVGFAEGDLRGFFWAEVGKSR